MAGSTPVGSQVYRRNDSLQTGDPAGGILFADSKALEAEIQKQLEELKYA